MPAIRQGTTPTVALIVHADIADWPTVVVSIENGGIVSDYTGDELTLETIELDDEPATLIKLALSQEETLRLEGRARIQVRAVDGDDVAVATCIKSARVFESINQGVI